MISILCIILYIYIHIPILWPKHIRVPPLVQKTVQPQEVMAWEATVEFPRCHWMSFWKKPPGCWFRSFFFSGQNYKKRGFLTGHRNPFLDRISQGDQHVDLVLGLRCEPGARRARIKPVVWDLRDQTAAGQVNLILGDIIGPSKRWEMSSCPLGPREIPSRPTGLGNQLCLLVYKFLNHEIAPIN